MTTFTDVPKEVDEILGKRNGTTSRRTFLKTSGLFVVSISASAIVRANPLSPGTGGGSAGVAQAGDLYPCNRDTARRKANAMWASTLLPPSWIIMAAKARAASTYVGSFSSTNDCCGVLLRGRCATHSSRAGASKARRLACQKLRRQ